MRLTDLFRSEETKRSRKRQAFQKVLAKLEKTRDKLERDLNTVGSKAKLKHLQNRLKTNGKQREKAKQLIAELDQGAPRHGRFSGLIGGNDALVPNDPH
ncbi:MAG: hypothetical protein ACR2PM_02680 [Hyphomicrobiales bacterium]